MQKVCQSVLRNAAYRLYKYNKTPWYTHTRILFTTVTKVWQSLRRFSQHSEILKSIIFCSIVFSYTEFYSNQVLNIETTNRNFFDKTL